MPPNRIDAYLDKHLELWRTRGCDRQYGGFHERLSAAGDPLPLGYKRLLVQCRQIFAHSLASRFGYTESAAVAQEGFAFLRQHYWDDRNAGWFFSATPDGKPHDRRKDLYGHAFVLLAAAEYYKAFRDKDALKLAGDTVEILEQHFAPAVPSGFAEVLSENWEYRPEPRLQNPHMHLLEGFIALTEVSCNNRYLTHARAIVDLLRPQLLSPRFGALAEYFDTDWQPESERGGVTEPGHCFEWSWLLRQYHRIAPEADILLLAERLYEWGVRHGFDAKNDGIFDEMSRDGKTIIKGSKRIWPLCEAIKAGVAQFKASPSSERRARLDKLLNLLFDRYLKPDGTWIEHFDRDWRPINTELPGSTSYHIVLALVEAKRALEATA